MPRWVFRTLCTLLVASLASLWSPAAAPAQIRLVTEATAVSDVENVLASGRELEIQRRWGEALSHYEDALRLHPQDARLKRQQVVARTHYDLGQRYADASYRADLTRLSEREALTVYSEVLLKIQSYFVERPDWNMLFLRGTECFEVALDDTVFLNEHLPGVSPQRIARFKQTLHATPSQRVIRDRHSLRDAVASVAQSADVELGLMPQAVVLEYVCATAKSLDDYSAYLTSGQLDDVHAQIDGNFVGLGIELKASDQSLLIVNTIPGSPAERAGLKAGDRILAVDGTTTRELTTDKAANLLQGEEGSTVEITVVTAGDAPRRVLVRREQVEVPSVEDVKIVDPRRGVAYFKLTCFQKTTKRDLEAALWRLHQSGMRSLIVDLRGNPGGLLVAAVDAVDMFVERGTVVSTRGRNPDEDAVYTAQRRGTWQMPLVVLIDGDSASASEIFAGAIRDHRRGTMVGTRSYGKGSVQGIFPLSVSRAGLRLTTAKFYSPDGRPFSHVGVQPDVLVHQVARPFYENQFSAGDDGAAPAAESADPVLEQALRVVRDQTTPRRGASSQARNSR